MIKVEPCKGCGDVIFVVDLGGVKIKADPTPMDGQTTIAAITDGRELYHLKRRTGTPDVLGTATPAVLGALNAPPDARPLVIRAHRCTPGSRPPVTPGVAGHPKAPQSLPVARQTVSRVPSTERSGVRGAATPASSHPNCSTCGLKLAQGEYVGIEIGDLLVWASHLDRCP